MNFEPTVISLIERVDSRRVQELLCSDLIINGQNIYDNAIVCLIEHLTNQSKNYTDSEKCPRFFVRGSLSCQTISNPIKAYIYQDSFVDIDLKNCHPAILELLCKENNLDCPMLSNYNNNLEEYRKIFDKKELLKQIHGGDSDLPEEIKNEIKACVKAIRWISSGKDLKTFDVINISDILFSKEREYLLQMKATIDQNLGQGKIVGLFHDGLVAENSALELLDQINQALPGGIRAVHKPWKIPTVNIVHKLTEFDWENPLRFVDLRQLHGSHYENQGSAYRAILPIALSTVRFLGGSWLAKNGDQVDHISKEIDKEYTISYGESKKIPLAKFIKNFAPLLEMEKLTNARSTHPKEFSCYRGFSFKQVEWDESTLDPLEHFLYDICCDGDMDTFHHFTHWLASILQHPDRKTEVMYVFSGLQGTGKSRLAHLLSRIFGRHTYMVEQGLGCLFNRFNKNLEGKNLLLLEELSGQNHKWTEIQDKLKDVITRSEYQTEKKYVEMYTNKCLLNLVAFSNFDNCMGMTEGLKRRVVMVKISNEMQENLEYFSQLTEYIDNDNMIDQFGSYLMSLDLSEFEVRKIPETNIKTRNIFRWSSAVYKALLILYKKRDACWILTRNVKEIIEQYLPGEKRKERIGEDVQCFLGIQHPTKRRYHLIPSKTFKVNDGLLAEAQKVIDEVDEAECMLDDDEIIIE